MTGTIYIVEDDANIRELVVYALNSGGFEAYGFETGGEFHAKMQSAEKPDLILLDIMLPGGDGLSMLKELRKNLYTSRIPIIMLTAKASEYDKLAGFELGADDYMTKPFSVLELISRVKAVLRRAQMSDADNVLTCKGITLDIPRHIIKSDGETISLTFKEFELLKYLIQNRGIVLSRNRITEKIWGFDFEGESRTVDMHIKTLRKKLGENGALIETVRGIGYKISEFGEERTL
ncbi:MAG: response regulator transcription factor [Oscillospiraceae bacterium]|jgi:two-component system alkaline phosphatase synthesis response regulator PhoP|nr:response regulator transcription factor [Oscillospiraceae bacterium]